MVIASAADVNFRCRRIPAEMIRRVADVSSITETVEPGRAQSSGSLTLGGRRLFNLPRKAEERRKSDGGHEDEQKYGEFREKCQTVLPSIRFEPSMRKKYFVIRNEAKLPAGIAAAKRGAAPRGLN